MVGVKNKIERGEKVINTKCKILLHNMILMKYRIKDVGDYVDVGIDTSLLRLLEDKSLCVFCILRNPERRHPHTIREHENIKGEEIPGVINEEEVLRILISLYKDIEEELERYLRRTMNILRKISLSSILRIFMIPYRSPYWDIEKMREGEVRRLKLRYHAYIIMREVLKFHRDIDIEDVEIFSSRTVKYPLRYVFNNNNIQIYDEPRDKEEKIYENILNLDYGYKEYVLSLLKEDHS